MSDPFPTPDAGTAADRPPPPRMPRWVKVSGIVVVLLILAVVLMMAIRDDDHGPDRHAPGHQPAEQNEQDAPGGHAPPEGGHE